MSHLDEWQPLDMRHGTAHLTQRPAPLYASRYGLSRNPDAMDWARRHAAPEWAPLAPDPRVRCRCPYAQQRPEQVLCHLAATQEDGLCDECRQWCVAVDSAGNYHLIADLPTVPR